MFTEPDPLTIKLRPIKAEHPELFDLQRRYPGMMEVGRCHYEQGFSAGLRELATFLSDVHARTKAAGADAVPLSIVAEIVDLSCRMAATKHMQGYLWGREGFLAQPDFNPAWEDKK